MVNIKKIIFLGCTFLLSGGSALELIANPEEDIAILTNILEFENDPKKFYECVTNIFIKTHKIHEIVTPLKLHHCSVDKKNYFTLVLQNFKKLPTNTKKVIYEAACGVKNAITRHKRQYQEDIKIHKNIIRENTSDVQKLCEAIKTIKENNNGKVEESRLKNLNMQLEKKRKEIDDATNIISELELEYGSIDFPLIEQWINKIKSAAYWNSGAGFFEQFWNLNWSGKLLTFMGTPLACYGAYKIYNEYMSTAEDDELEDDQATNPEAVAKQKTR